MPLDAPWRVVGHTTRSSFRATRRWRSARSPGPAPGCPQTYGPVPPDLRKLDRVAIVPAPGSVDSCTDDFAVQLFMNADGDLAAVSLLMGEP